MPDFREDQAAGLRRLMSGPKPRVVTLLSAAAGNELPRILSNLAASFRQYGSDALIVHAGDANAEALRHYRLTGMATLADAARGKHALYDALRQADQGYTSTVLAPAHLACNPLPQALANDLGRMLGELAEQYDVVLVEAALDEAQQLPLAMLDDGDIVIQLDRKPASIQQAYRLIKQLHGRLGSRPFGILVNGADETEAKAVFNNVAGVARRYLGLKLDFVGHIPADEHMARATNLGRSVIDAFPMATVSRAFTALAGRLGYRRQNAAMPATCS